MKNDYFKNKVGQSYLRDISFMTFLVIFKSSSVSKHFNRNMPLNLLKLLIPYMYRNI